MSCRVSANNPRTFQGSFEIVRSATHSLLGSFTVKKAGVPGVPGFSLTPSIGGSIGFSPYASTSGVAVTSPLNLSFKNTNLSGSVPATLTWEIEPGDGGSRGALDWLKVRLAYESDVPVDPSLTSYDVREVEFYPHTITPESGQFYRTIVASGRSTPGHSEFSYQFVSIPSGQYQLICEAKQTFNPTPYVIVSGLTVGTIPHTIAASGVPSSGENPLSVNLFSSRTDSTNDPTKYIHWDLGTERLYGDNTSFYQNPTHVFDRQGYYNPVVTHITTSGFVISQALPSGFEL